MNKDRLFPLSLIVGSLFVLYVAFSIFGMAAQTSRAQANTIAQSMGPYTHTVVIGFSWAPGHEGPIDITKTVASSFNVLTVEIRDRDGVVAASQSGSIANCDIVIVTPPATPVFPEGWCNGLITLTFGLPRRWGWEEWAQGKFYITFEDGSGRWFYTGYADVPGPDERSFYLIDTIEEPTPTPTLTPTPTATASTPTNTPALVPTDTPMPLPDLAAHFRQLAEEHRRLAELYEFIAMALERQ